MASRLQLRALPTSCSSLRLAGLEWRHRCARHWQPRQASQPILIEFLVLGSAAWKRALLAEVQYVNVTSSWHIVKSVVSGNHYQMCTLLGTFLLSSRSLALSTGGGDNGDEGKKVFCKLQIHFFTQQAYIVHPLYAKCHTPSWDMNHGFIPSTVPKTQLGRCLN